MNRFTGQERNGLNAFWIDSLCFLLFFFSKMAVNEWEKGGGDATMEISGRKVFSLSDVFVLFFFPPLLTPGSHYLWDDQKILFSQGWDCSCVTVVGKKKKDLFKTKLLEQKSGFLGFTGWVWPFSCLRKGLKTHFIIVIKEINVWNHNWIIRIRFNVVFDRWCLAGMSNLALTWKEAVKERWQKTRQ